MITIEDKIPRQVILSKFEVDFIIEELERMPHSAYEFFKCDKTIDKLKKAKKVEKK